jgi:hypothetical protein
MRSVAIRATYPKIIATTLGAADPYENLAQMCEAKKVVSEKDEQLSPVDKIRGP